MAGAAMVLRTNMSAPMMARFLNTSTMPGIASTWSSVSTTGAHIADVLAARVVSKAGGDTPRRVRQGEQHSPPVLARAPSTYESWPRRQSRISTACRLVTVGAKTGVRKAHGPAQ